MSRVRRNAAVAAVAVAMIGGFEGLRQTVYADPIGIPTVCFGSTKGLTREMVGRVTYTREQCNDLLRKEIVEHEAGMRACLRNPDRLTDGQYVAFLSLTFNIGVGAFCRSTAARMLNEGNTAGACAQISRWDKAAGIRLPGLVKRRAEERRICEVGL